MGNRGWKKNHFLVEKPQLEDEGDIRSALGWSDVDVRSERKCVF